MTTAADADAGVSIVWPLTTTTATPFVLPFVLYMWCTALFFRFLLSALLFFCCDLLLHCVFSCTLLWPVLGATGGHCNGCLYSCNVPMMKKAVSCCVHLGFAWFLPLLLGWLCLLSRSGGGSGAKMMPPVFSRKRAVKMCGRCARSLVWSSPSLAMTLQKWHLSVCLCWLCAGVWLIKWWFRVSWLVVDDD